MSPREFHTRRQRLLRRIGKNAAAVIAGAPAAQRNRDVDFPYRQNSDFHYLTGFDEPESLAFFLPGRSDGEFVLFCREYDPKQAVWTGHHAGLEGARRDHGADQAHPIGEVDKLAPGLLEGRTRIYFPMEAENDLPARVQGWIRTLRAKARSGVKAPDELVALEKPLHEMRLFKSKGEIALMREAARVSVAAHRRALRASRPGMREYQIEAELLHEFTLAGLRAPAYPSIVAAGRNACVLHYTENGAELKDGDLLLIDAGAEHEYYAADITRTFPINGRFSPEQRAIYQLVLDAQASALEHIRPGARWNEPHDAAVRTLTKGLIGLGLLKGKLDKQIEREKYKRFFMHRTGHWLGMDVHDVGDYKVEDEWRLLEPGMTLTVEPGLYIAPDCDKVDKKWRGIGVRIEDDVLVTPAGHEVLTADAPKTVAEIEACMGTR
ncbi:MAG TPA: Xaa-Pro aminopeptidase [Methylococcaceae bacterium]|nr:Xaa-Pro aminopeptidase [Methylococcaceae bacterium]